MKYPINEIFYSLKGEGMYTGTPMLFLRLHGCNLNCDFCDTEEKLLGEYSIDQIISHLTILNKACKRIVITGGEPTIHKLNQLVVRLRAEGFIVHLETNGSNEVDYMLFNWIAVSPKQLPIAPRTLLFANEIKFLWDASNIERWSRLLWTIVTEYDLPGVQKYLMPLAKSIKEGDRSKSDIIQENVNSAITFCKDNIDFGLCMQMHKIWGIP